MKILMWSLVVIFALWGLGSVATSRKTYAGIVFGKKVSFQDYNRSYNAVLNRAKMMYGDKLPKLEKFLNLRSQAWDRLILEYSAKKKHIRVSNKEVVERIASFPFFQRNGVFDDRLYTYIVSNVFQSSPRDFEEAVRNDIKIDKLINSVTGDIDVTDEEIRDAYRAENETADVSYILINPEPYKKDITVSDNEMLALYRKNKDDFRSPIMLNVEYIKIPFGDDKEEARFEAEQVLSQARESKNLKSTANENSLAAQETGPFSINSTIPGVGLSYPFTLAALRLERGDISDLVETNDSFYIIELKSKTPPAVLSFEEVQDRVKDILINQKASDMAKEYALSIVAQIQSSDESLEDAANEFGYKILKSKSITKNSYIEEIGPSDSFTETAFSLNAGDTGGPSKTQKGYAIIRLDSLTPMDEEKFNKEKEGFAEKFLSNKKNEYFQKWFLDLKKKANLKNNLS